MRGVFIGGVALLLSCGDRTGLGLGDEPPASTGTAVSQEPILLAMTGDGRVQTSSDAVHFVDGPKLDTRGEWATELGWEPSFPFAVDHASGRVVYIDHDFHTHVSFDRGVTWSTGGDFVVSRPFALFQMIWDGTRFLASYGKQLPSDLHVFFATSPDGFEWTALPDIFAGAAYSSGFMPDRPDIVAWSTVDQPKDVRYRRWDASGLHDLGPNPPCTEAPGEVTVGDRTFKTCYQPGDPGFHQDLWSTTDFLSWRKEDEIPDELSRFISWLGLLPGGGVMLGDRTINALSRDLHTWIAVDPGKSIRGLTQSATTLFAFHREAVDDAVPPRTYETSTGRSTDGQTWTWSPMETGPDLALRVRIAYVGR